MNEKNSLYVFLTLIQTATQLYWMQPCPSQLIIKRILRMFINTVGHCCFSEHLAHYFEVIQNSWCARYIEGIAYCLCLPSRRLNKLSIVLSVEITANILFYALIPATSTSIWPEDICLQNFRQINVGSTWTFVSDQMPITSASYIRQSFIRQRGKQLYSQFQDWKSVVCIPGLQMTYRI